MPKYPELAGRDLLLMLTVNQPRERHFLQRQPSKRGNFTYNSRRIKIHTSRIISTLPRCCSVRPQCSLYHEPLLHCACQWRGHHDAPSQDVTFSTRPRPRPLLLTPLPPTALHQKLQRLRQGLKKARNRVKEPQVPAKGLQAYQRDLMSRP